MISTVILFIVGGLALFGGMGIVSGAKSSVHEIAGFVLFLISAVLFVGAILNKSIKEFHNDLVPKASDIKPAKKLY